MIECLRCINKNIGETKRMLRKRFKLRQATNNPNHSNAAAAVPIHFNLPGHSAKGMRLITLELQRSSNNGSRRKARAEEPCHQMVLTNEMNVNYLQYFSTSLRHML